MILNSDYEVLKGLNNIRWDFPCIPVIKKTRKNVHANTYQLGWNIGDSQAQKRRKHMDINDCSELMFRINKEELILNDLREQLYEIRKTCKHEIEWVEYYNQCSISHEMSDIIGVIGVCKKCGEKKSIRNLV